MRKREFVDACKGIVLDAQKQLLAAREKVDAAKKLNPNIYASEYIEKEWRAANAECDSIVSKCLSDVGKTVQGFKNGIGELTCLHADKLTADARLLTGGFNLTRNDLEQMSKKTENNNQTMRRLISEYAQNHAIMADIPTFYSERDLVDAAEAMNTYAASVMQRPEYDWSGYNGAEALTENYGDDECADS